MKEQDLAAVVVAYLEALGADVYQEVTVRGGVADIVARVGAEIWIIEVKTQLSLALLVQGMERRTLAHRVYVAAPPSRTMRDFTWLAKELGIGVLSVQVNAGFDATWKHDQPRVTTEAESKRWNTRPVVLAAALAPEHKTHAKAGAAGAAGRWTPFRSTCEQVARIVKSRPGVTIGEIIDDVKHHYASNAGAKSSLVTWAQQGAIDGVEARNEDGRIRLYPKAVSHAL